MSSFQWGMLPSVTAAAIAAATVWRARRRRSAWEVWRIVQAADPRDEPTFKSLVDRLASRRNHAVVVVRRKGSHLEHYLAAPAGAVTTADVTIAFRQVGAKPERLPTLPSLAPRVVAACNVPTKAIPAADQRNDNPKAVAHSLEAAMVDGDVIAVTFRGQRKRERLALEAWFRSHLAGDAAAHNRPQVSWGATVSEIWIGSARRHQIDTIRAAMFNELDRWGLPVTVRTQTALGAVAALTALSIVCYLPTMTATHTLTWWQAGCIASIPAGAAIAISLGVLPSRESRIRRALLSGRYPPPLRHQLQTIPRPRRRDPDRDPEFRSWRATWPLRTGDIPMAAGHLAAVAAPQASVSSGARSIADLEAPPALLERVGPMLGHAPSGAPIHLAQSSRSGGLSIFGTPNSGKSLLLRRVWAFDLLDRQRGPLLDGCSGPRNSIIGIAAKASDAVVQLAWCHAFRQDVYLVDLLDPSTCAIDLFSSHKPPHERAVDAVNLFTFIFGEDSIGNIATPALRAVMGGAFVAHDHPDLFAGITTTPASPIHTARLLIGSDQRGRELGQRIIEFAEAHETTTGNAAGGGDLLTQATTDVGRAGERLRHYLTMPPGDFRRQFESSTNKIGRLVDVEEWFSQARPKLTWRQVLDDHLVVVVNAGRPINTTAKASTYDTKTVNDLTAAMLCSLRQAIAERCDGWQDQQRSVSIFSDEVSQLAPPNSEQADADLRWLRDQGRAFGVRLGFATQYPEQLSPRMRNSLKGFDTKIWMQQSNDLFMDEGARDLGGDTVGITPADLRALPRFHGLVATRVHGQALQPCLVNVAMSEPGGIVDAGMFADHHQAL